MVNMHMQQIWWEANIRYIVIDKVVKWTTAYKKRTYRIIAEAQISCSGRNIDQDVCYLCSNNPGWSWEWSDIPFCAVVQIMCLYTGIIIIQGLLDLVRFFQRLEIWLFWHEHKKSNLLMEWVFMFTRNHWGFTRFISSPSRKLCRDIVITFHPSTFH